MRVTNLAEQSHVAQCKVYDAVFGSNWRNKSSNSISLINNTNKCVYLIQISCTVICLHVCIFSHHNRANVFNFNISIFYYLLSDVLIEKNIPKLSNFGTIFRSVSRSRYPFWCKR